MDFKSEAELRAWAVGARDRLRAVGIESQIDSVHDYLIKLSIVRDGQPFGKLKVYHKPTKGIFTLDFSELKNGDAIVPAIRESIEGTRFAAQSPAKLPTAGSKDQTGSSAPPAPSSNLKGWHIYVDGSYVRGRIGYGAVILEGGELRQALQGVVTDPESKSVHQVAGELAATTRALEWCAEHDIAAVHIHHDYTGIAFWATGQWKTNTMVTQRYADFFKQQPVQVTWHKVAAHTGDYWNEYVDRLAGGESPAR